MLLLGIIILCAIKVSTYEFCHKEIYDQIINSTWSINNNHANLLCDYKKLLKSSNCSNTDTIVNYIKELNLCHESSNESNPSSCPPGFNEISSNNKEYCYQIGDAAAWDFPCFKSGGASVLTDFYTEDLQTLLDSLSKTNTSRYFWLPARRKKLFNPVTWSIPGPNWGKQVVSTPLLRMVTSIFRTCLLLDMEQRIIKTEDCNTKYPSLCFYLNDLEYPSKCPEKYQAFRFMPDNGTCYGIELSETNLSYQDFIATKCKKPMGNNEQYKLNKFIYRKIRDLYELNNEKWCWFGSGIQEKYLKPLNMELYRYNKHILKSVINLNGDLSFLTSNYTLSCMACQAELVYGETDLILDYNDYDDKLYLTIYYPSGLWKYSNNDTGVQCFSNAHGFLNVVKIDDMPFAKVKMKQMNDTFTAEKIVYAINPVTDRSAQYWCEGHSTNFTFIRTNKLIVRSHENNEHVFVLVLKKFALNDNQENIPDMTNLITDIYKIFKANKVLIMDILEYTIEYIMIVMHLHVTVDNTHEDNIVNLKETYNTLYSTATSELSNHNYTFVNMSSALFCFPTTTNDIIVLEWELTPIDHIAAPRQFCLQENGLPVKRKCLGSYVLGSIWGNIEGKCDESFVASKTTKILYNFFKGQAPENVTSRFLTDILGFVLNERNIIIPADIYYLSMSLQHILKIAHENLTLIDTGGIKNIAWIIDRIIDLDYSYLRLSQTLNSTNVILDSVNDIIEILVEERSKIHNVKTHSLTKKNYQLVVKSQFIVQISYPGYNNITGIAISKKSLSNNFSDMIVHPLYKNVTLKEVMSIENLEIASWLPNDVIKSLKRKSSEPSDEQIHNDDMSVVISIFYNDAMFQELDLETHHVNSRIIGISVPGFLTDLKYSIPLVFRDLQNSYGLHKFCGYWNFQAQNFGNAPGYWSKQGCYLMKTEKNITVCECYHLTHFGQLLQINNNNENELLYVHHAYALNIITLVGSFLSLIGLVGIWITALVFTSWRKKTGTKILLQLSTSISLPLILLIIFNLETSMFVKQDNTYYVAQHLNELCIFLGALLHYTTLASFVWMLITAILQFIRYVRVLGVFRPSRFMMKCTLIGWGLPLIPVTIVLFLNPYTYIPDPLTNGLRHICYPSGLYFVMGILAPVCIILIINVILFVLVMHSISSGPNKKLRSSDKDLRGSQMRLLFILFFLLGLTWIFGLLSFSTQAHLIWSYLFCLTSTVQDFILFIYFVICDPVTRNLWINLITTRNRRSSTSLRESVFSISSG